MLFAFYAATLIQGSALAKGKDSDGDGMPDRWEIAHNPFTWIGPGDD